MMMLIVFCILCIFSVKLGVAVTDYPMSKSAVAISQAVTGIGNLHTRASSEILSSKDPEVIIHKSDISSRAAAISEENLNKVVDKLIVNLQGAIMKAGKDSINVPNLKEEFSKKIWPITFHGNFKAQKGWLKSLSSIHRATDCKAMSKGKDLSVSCGIGLSNLEVGYKKYRAEFMNKGINGNLRGTVGKNSLYAEATLYFKNNKCIAELRDFRLTQFGDLELEVTGLGHFNWLLSRISTWIVRAFEGKIKEKLESTLKDLIKEKLKDFDCKEIVSGM